MREILFRGKQAYNDEWAYSEYPFGTIHGGIVVHDFLPETVGQYTGLTDKNGKKIFEGDYWLDTDDDYLVYVVDFREGQFGFACYGTKGMLMPYGFDEDAGGWGEIDFEPMTDFNIGLIEIIGNIHDNPELLKGGAE